MASGNLKEFGEFQYNLDIYGGQYEDTVLTALLPFIIKLDRTIQGSPARLATGAVEGSSTI